MRSLSLMGMLLAVVGVCVRFAAAPAAAEDAKYVKLVQTATGKVLTIEGASEEAGARAITGKDEAGEVRQWKLEKDGDHYKLVNRKTGKVLDVFEASMDEGVAIIQWDDKPEDNDNQRWAWQGEGKDRRLKSKSSGLVLDVDSDGKVIQKKADESAKSQLWNVVEVKE